MNELVYSILRYEPSLVSGETINLGAIFYYPDTGYREFYSIKKWSRVSSFDDTLNIPLLKDLMLDISDEIGTVLTNPNFDIKHFCSQYDSELYFDNCTTFTDVTTDSLSAQIEEIKQMYFQFEYEVVKRPKKDDQKKFLRRLLKESRIKYTADYSSKGKFDADIDYDFVFGDYGVVLFNLNSSEINNNTMNKVKAWAWNADHRNDNYQLIVLYITDDENREDIQPALNIFRSITKYTINIHRNGFSDVNSILTSVTQAI